MATPEVGGNRIRLGNGSACIIFIHGILSSSEQAWTNSNGTCWPSLLADETALADSPGCQIRNSKRASAFRISALASGRSAALGRGAGLQDGRYLFSSI